MKKLFNLKSDFQPAGDQPTAIKALEKGLASGVRYQTLLGVTGSGKTFTVANIIASQDKPVLVLAPNKALAAQLYREYKNYFPENAVHYFVSYYDYYQPEAYIPQTDTYIEKDAKINEEIDRLRHATTQDLLTRQDVIVIASVSCIYNIGSPEAYQQVSLEIKSCQKIRRKNLIAHLTSLQYQRNDIDFKPGTFRVRGEIVEIFSVTGEEIIRIEFSGDKIEQIRKCKTASRNFEMSNVKCQMSKVRLYPAHFWVTPQEKLGIAIENIKLELQEQLKKLKKEKKLLEAQRLEQRTNYDLEMLKETGFCHGVENYSRHLEFRKPGEAPFTLLDYYRGDFLVFIDESHVTLSQLRAMAVQDKARKKTLIEYGFRLPSAIDNRPLEFNEFEDKIKQAVYVSATPGPYEMQKIRNSESDPSTSSGSSRAKSRDETRNPDFIKDPRQSRDKFQIPNSKFKTKNPLFVEQLIRPTGLLEPSIEVRPTKNQVKDLIEEIKKRGAKRHRTLVLTLTKRLAEALADYLTEEGISCQWLHSEIKTLERPKILKELREGKYDVLVGINLLREGLDLPEVALVAILDADKEGFLRSETTLIQTMGRAARHLEGHVILYADKITKSMAAAIKEVKRRREIQAKYNKKQGITPKSILKEIRDWPFTPKEKEIISEFGAIQDVKLLEKEMKTAAKNLDFERAAEIRDLIKELKVQSQKSKVAKN